MKTKLTWSIHRFRMNNGLRNILVAALCLATASIEAVVPSSAGQNEVSATGNLLWLREKASGKAEVQYNGKASATIDIALSELKKAWNGKPMILEKKSNKMHKDGFSIVSDNGKIHITTSTDAGLLYGVYHLLRLQATGTDREQLQVTEQPAYNICILNHWDNLDATIERGYAGRSL